MKNKGKSSEKKFPVVCVGASAGGLKAIISLFSGLRKNTGMAFVVIQHLEPRHESILAEIIARNSAMKVYQIKNRMRIRPDSIYVIPPDSNISMQGRRFITTPRDEKRTGIYRPIDHFLRSLAGHGERAVAVILSGTGSDGASGINAVKENGGIIFAQDRGSAEYYSMPESAIGTGIVDYILPPEAIAEKLLEIKFPRRTRAGAAPEHAGENGIEGIFSILRQESGVDFGNYKRTTVMRRITRRMDMHGIGDYGRYGRMLKENPAETKTFYRDLLISVTYFFREPKAFKTLTGVILPEIFKKRPAKETVRIWVPGCSTGEEVYSIAILLHEFLEAGRYRAPVLIFGTDLNESQVEKARSGKYPESISQDVPERLLRKFFTREEGGYKISRNIRDMCIFSRQNIAVDPPLSGMDIISFRNVMIYLDQEMQKRIIPVLHYSLKPSGFLILG